MTPDQILSHPPNFLTPAQRAAFFEQGYLCLPDFVPDALLARMRAGMRAAMARTRSLTASNEEFSLEPDHTPSSPRPSRLYRACDDDPSFWDYAAGQPLVELVADLVGPDVRYREAYINYKCPRGGVAVHWHQDLAFVLHTNRCVLSTITYLEDVTPEMAPLMVVPGSHRGEIFDHYDEAGAFVGRISEADLVRTQVDAAVSLPGPAGTVTVFDGGTLHASHRNDSDTLRPILAVGYAAADSFPFTDLPPEHTDSHAWQIIRGRPATYAHHEPMRIQVPPDWSQDRFEPIFDMQREAGE